MSRVCQISGTRPLSGNKVSHSNRRVKRKFYPNIQKKRFYIPEKDEFITLKVTTSVIRTINKKGITAYLNSLKKKGIKVNI